MTGGIEGGGRGPGGVSTGANTQDGGGATQQTMLLLGEKNGRSGGNETENETGCRQRVGGGSDTSSSSDQMFL